MLPLALSLMLSPAFPCRAEGVWNGSVGAATDYVYRGVSQTYDSAALQLGGNYQSPLGWFVGAWGSNVNPYPHAGSSAELDLYAGATRPLGEDFSTRVAYTHYTYLDDPRHAHYDYDELSVTAAYLDRLSATVSYEPDSVSYSTVGFERHRAVAAFELTGRYPVLWGLAVTGGVGYYDLQQLFGVNYWAGNVGLAYVYKRLTIEVDTFIVDSTVARLYGEQSANGTWTLSAVYRF
jgi:uncharacterized protein (TIGR02001 family)